MISINNIKRACLAALSRQLDSANAREEDGALVLGLVQSFQAPDFFVNNSTLGFFTGVDKTTGTPCFLLDLEASRRLIRRLEQRLGCELSDALVLVEAGLVNQAHKYDMLQQVNLANESQYKGVINSFPKMARQSKSQAFYQDVRTQLSSASELSVPLGRTAVQALIEAATRGRRGGGARARTRVRMFVSLDFEWWEKSSETILEMGWSLWDTLTQRHRTRHWIIKDNLNKHNGGYIADNRMNYLFGTSERGSLERAFDALQAELDAAGVSDGLTRQQKDLLDSCYVELVLVGHALNQDQEHAELFEIEWPEGMLTFDTQKLFVGWQLEQMDAAAASAALQDLMSRRRNAANGVKPATLELVDQYEEAQESEDDGYGEPDDLDSDDSDYGLPGTMSALAIAKRAKQRPGSAGSGGSSRIAAVQPEKRKAVQGPVRVRPWPAGPLPSENEEKTDKGESKPKDKINRQIGLGPMLAELKIKSQRLHNAGNDARFTMEAFLALTGHPVCGDPFAAHNSALQHDPRYKQQLEASIQAAAEQGWGAPVPVQPPKKHSRAYSPASSSGSTPAPTTANGKGAWGKPPAAAAGAGGGKPAPAAAAGAGSAYPASQAAPSQQQQQQQRKAGSAYLPKQPYQPSEDSW